MIPKQIASFPVSGLVLKNNRVKFTKCNGIVYGHLFSFRVFTDSNIC